MKNVILAISLTCLCFTSAGLYMFATGKISRPESNYLNVSK